MTCVNTEIGCQYTGARYPQSEGYRPWRKPGARFLRIGPPPCLHAAGVECLPDAAGKVNVKPGWTLALLAALTGSAVVLSLTLPYAIMCARDYKNGQIAECEHLSTDYP